MVYTATFEELQSVWQPEPTTSKVIVGDGESSKKLGRGGVFFFKKSLQIGVVMCFFVACFTVSFFHNKEFIPFLFELVAEQPRLLEDWTIKDQSIVAKTSPGVPADVRGSWGLAATGDGSHDEFFWCDRRDKRSDVCFLHGDVLLRTGNLSDVVLRASSPETARCQHVEVIRPYTRKWEPNTMASVEPMTLRIDGSPNGSRVLPCGVHHSVPAVLFSTGGFTGNPYHDFQDVLIPLFIASQHSKGEVVFVISDARRWWIRRWISVLQQLTKYPIIYSEEETGSHCFPEITVGLYVHKELGIDSARMPNGESMVDFQNVLQRALGSASLEAISGNQLFQPPMTSTKLSSMQNNPDNITRHLKLLIVARAGNRILLNQRSIMKLAKSLNFETTVLRPSDHVELPVIYSTFHDSDVVMGVHGAGLAHIVFMKTRAVFIQIVPLGTDWPSDHYYKRPAKELKLQYIEYKINPIESSLSKKYGSDHPIVRNPDRFTSEGWETVKQIYLSDQNVRLNSKRFRKTLLQAKEKALVD